MALVAEARQLVASEDNPTALERLTRAVELDPTNSDARRLQQQLGESASSDGSETREPEPTVEEPTQVASAATTRPVRGGAARPSRTARSRASSSAAEEPAASSSSGAIAQVMTLYKRGQFDGASDRARELSVSAPTGSERGRARSLARRIDRFAKVWRGVQSGSSTRQKLSNLQQALTLDRQISGGHFTPQIRPKLRDTLVANAQRAWSAGQYASACSSAMQALKLDRGSGGATSIASKCGSKARDYFEQGNRARSSDLNKARSLWRKVISMVPQGSPWYTKAYSALNNAGRRRELDEDE